MNLDPLATRYVQAFSHYLSESSRVATLSDLLAVTSAFASFPQWVAVFSSPKWAREEKMDRLNALLSALGVSNDISRFFQVLVKNNRLELVHTLPAVIQDHLDELTHRIRPKFVFATDVSDDIKSDLLEQFKGISKKEIVASYATNPELLGGFQVFFENKVLDGSLAKSIEKLAAKLEVA